MRFTPLLLTVWTLYSLSLTAHAAEPPLREPGFVSIFNGRDLSGWEGEEDYWRVVDGMIEGAADRGGQSTNSWLIWRDGTLKNFHLKLKFRILAGNSGVFYRAVDKGNFGGRGYQAEVADGPFGTGKLHHGGGKRGANADVGQFMINQQDSKGLLVGAVADSKWLIKLPYYVPGEWSAYDIIARGNHITHFVNGIPTVEFIDRDEKDPERKRRVDEGLLGLQLHGREQMKVQFKDIRVRQFTESFQDALLLFNGKDLEGWSVPPEAGSCWNVEADGVTNPKKSDAGKLLVCDGSGESPLLWDGKPPQAFVLRFQRFCDHSEPCEGSPFRTAAGWETVEITVRGKQSRMEVNGLEQADGPPPLHDGRIALPSNVAAEYRNIVLIAFEP